MQTSKLKSTKKTAKSTVTQRDILELKELMAKNLYKVQKLETFSKKVERFIFWSRVTFFLKVLVVVLPIVLAYIYVMPWLEDLLGQFSRIINVVP